jgi:hypothetical protein
LEIQQRNLPCFLIHSLFNPSIIVLEDSAASVISAIVAGMNRIAPIKNLIKMNDIKFRLNLDKDGGISSIDCRHVWSGHQT